MSYTYKGLTFPTRLQAYWAAFFDVVGWTWHTNPVAVGDWQPDFLVSFPCGHSECGGSHTLLVSVGPYESEEQLQGHPALRHQWGVESENGHHVADAGAVFGSKPSVSKWTMSHGAGGGVFRVSEWVDGDVAACWERAVGLVDHELTQAPERLAPRSLA